jgi:hypothetical protein
MKQGTHSHVRRQQQAAGSTERGGMTFRGYTEPVAQKMLHEGREMFSGDLELQLTHAYTFITSHCITS